MIVCRSSTDQALGRSNKTRGFVPTMGALHAGHVSLIRKSIAENMETVVSIFVNPLQFGPNEDLARYPRPIENDLKLCEEAGADIVFVPGVEDLTASIETRITVGRIGSLFEGALRPGHFDGVATIVAKLFHIIGPEIAYFGCKDLQQCALVRQIVRDLNFPLRLSFEPTIRERDGLALSSRNMYLDSHHRLIAPSLYFALEQTRKGIIEGQSVHDSISSARAFLESKGVRIDYLDLVNRSTFEPCAILGADQSLIIAGHLGTTRLIDNVLVSEA